MSGGWRRQMGTRYWNCAGNYSRILVGCREQGEPCPNMNRRCGLNETQRTWTLVPQKSVGLRKLLPNWRGREGGLGERMEVPGVLGETISSVELWEDIQKQLRTLPLTSRVSFVTYLGFSEPPLTLLWSEFTQTTWQGCKGLRGNAVSSLPPPSLV